MSSCWIIESGTYSSYRVLGIYSTQERAKTALTYLKSVENYWHDDAEITERPFDHCISELGDGMTQYGVRMRGNRTDVGVRTDLEPEDMHWNDGAFYHVWAESPEEAIKIAAERHSQWQISQMVLK